MQHLKMALIGEHISRSRLSRAMAILCARNDVTLEFVAIDTALISDFDFEQQLVQLRDERFTGATVTHPYKTSADAQASKRIGYPATMGASNLLKFDGLQTLAFNTDFTGFISAWRAKFGTKKPGSVAVAGAGGVARAIVAALIELGATKITIWDLQKHAAFSLGIQLDPEKTVLIPIEPDEVGSALQSADGLVNATPLGMVEYPGMAIEQAAIGPQKWAFDAVYTPLKTQFLNAANSAGLVTLSGFDLFRHMAVRTFAYYTDIELLPEDVELLEPLSQNL